jgi:hypothetical protein
LNFRSHDDVIKAIVANGGLFEEQVTPSTTIVLSTEEMGYTLGYFSELIYFLCFLTDI